MPGYGATDRLRTYGIFGGVPGHLALLDPSEPPATNVRRRLLEPTAPGLDDYMGPVFEEICRAAMHARPELLPCEPFRTGSWWSADARDQVDVVALSGQGELLVGECKWGSVGARDLGALRRRASLFAAELDGISRVHCALFSGRGVSDESVRKAAESGEVLLFGPEDLFPPAA